MIEHRLIRPRDLSPPFSFFFKEEEEKKKPRYRSWKPWKKDLRKGGGEDKTEEGSFYFASVDFWRSLKRVVGSWLRLYARWRSSGAGFFSFTNDEHPFFFFFSVWLSSDKRRVWTSLDELSSSLVNRVSGFLFLDKILLISCSSNLAFFLLLQSFLTINFASLVWILLFFFPITKYTNCLEKRIDHNLTFLYLIKPSMLKHIYIYILKIATDTILLKVETRKMSEIERWTRFYEWIACVATGLLAENGSQDVVEHENVSQLLRERSRYTATAVIITEPWRACLEGRSRPSHHRPA